MVIVFYDDKEDVFYICSEYDKTKKIGADDPNLLDYIPNDDILYVQDAHVLSKHQFDHWLSDVTSMPEDDEVTRFTGFLSPKNISKKKDNAAYSKQPSVDTSRVYIHPTANGTVQITDISTPKFPNGLELNGKWHFIDVADVGEDELNESQHFKVLLAKGKVEIVDEKFYQANKHKTKKKSSPAQAALDAILVPTGIKAAEAAGGYGADDGGYGTDDGGGAIEILVEPQ